jgi:hypothetical protein
MPGDGVLRTDPEAQLIRKSRVTVIDAGAFEQYETARLSATRPFIISVRPFVSFGTGREYADHAGSA